MALAYEFEIDVLQEEATRHRELYKFVSLVRKLMRDGGGADAYDTLLRRVLEGSQDREKLLLALQRSYPDVNDCSDCDKPAWDTREVENGDIVCAACVERHYVECRHCNDLVHSDEARTVEDYGITCTGCADNFYWCDDCASYTRYEHDDHDDNDSSDDACSCSAPERTFTFPANGHGQLANDTRMTVTLPAGVIDEEGMSQIALRVHAQLSRYGDECYTRSAMDIYDALIKGTLIEPQWQTKAGNFTKRLSKALYTQYKVKMPPHLVSDIGNIANQHTCKESAYHIEFTRMLNQAAYMFGHEDSCYWQSYYHSRCALKIAGGIGLRAYLDADADVVVGRVWVFPLDDNLRNTHSTNAHAYMAFNGYGTLSGYTGARLVAHLADRSYKKVGFTCEPMFINGSSGVLVADQATLEGITDINLRSVRH